MNDDLASMIRIADYATEYVATVASLSPFEVIFRGQQVAAVNGMSNHYHVIGDPVRVIRSDQQLVVTSTAAKLPVLAVVSAYAGGTQNCAVVAGDDTFDAQILGSGWTPAVGERVAILWTSAGPFALKRGGPVASPADPPAPPDYMNVTSGPDLPTPPPPPSGPQTAVLYAQQTATYISSSGALYTGESARYWVYAGPRGSDAVDGYWFFGDQVGKVKGATVTKTEVWLQRAVGVGPSGGVFINMVLHNVKTKPTSGPSSYVELEEEVAVLNPGQSGWFVLPTLWGQRIANGTGAGVGMVWLDEPYKALIGIDHPDATKRNPQSGALRITYKRS